MKTALPSKHLFLGLVALLVGLAGLVGLLTLTVQPLIYQSRAVPEGIPGEVKITNLSENSFSVSWITDKSTVGSLAYGTTADLNLVAFDDRGGNTTSTLHHITLKNLEPGGVYYFRLVSGGHHFDNQGSPYIFAARSHSSATPAPPFVIKGNAPRQSLVYFSFRDSTPISTLTDENGRFLLTLNNALAKNERDYYPVQKGEKGYLLFHDGQQSWVQEIVVQDEMTVVDEAPVETKDVAQAPSALKGKLPKPAESRWRTLWQKIVQFFQYLWSLLFRKHG